MRIRTLSLEDAEAYLALRRELFAEAPFMLLEPDELPSSASEEMNWLRSLLESHNSTIVLADDSGKLAGFAAAFGQNVRRRSHTALIVIGILREYRGKGIGKKLMTELEAWARDRGLKRLELQVVPQNDVALNLYQSLGFVLEGTKRMSMIAYGKSLDEHVMAKLLTTSNE